MVKHAIMILLLPLFLLGLTFGQDAALKAGDRAPDFKLPGSDGNEYSLSQFAGKSSVVIAWFPKAFTGG